ncbi:hypothetical protein CEXT_132521 [Caerostris extrusa]|uniref:Uncharacterized protein n=1 Tax=Caerostris extrusa TaxID=172846 RepID=A0AAV4Y6Z8_CAEEX|nr:hypothetical protein CEXT_132521 [Caerostris extrusa]
MPHNQMTFTYYISEHKSWKILVQMSSRVRFHAQKVQNAEEKVLFFSLNYSKGGVAECVQGLQFLFLSTWNSSACLLKRSEIQTWCLAKHENSLSYLMTSRQEPII